MIFFIFCNNFYNILIKPRPGKIARNRIARTPGWRTGERGEGGEEEVGRLLLAFDVSLRLRGYNQRGWNLWYSLFQEWPPGGNILEKNTYMREWLQGSKANLNKGSNHCMESRKGWGVRSGKSRQGSDQQVKEGHQFLSLQAFTEASRSWRGEWGQRERLWSSLAVLEDLADQLRGKAGR